MKYLISAALLSCVVLFSFSTASAGDRDCAPCDGKVDNALMRYDGSTTAYVQVDTRKGITLFEGYLNPFQSFSLSGSDNTRDRKSTLGPAINIYVDGVLSASFHTSCSEPFGPGVTEGDFVVIAGTSRNNGLLCPVAPIPPIPGG